MALIFQIKFLTWLFLPRIEHGISCVQDVYLPLGHVRWYTCQQYRSRNLSKSTSPVFFLPKGECARSIMSLSLWTLLSSSNSSSSSLPSVSSMSGIMSSPDERDPDSFRGNPRFRLGPVSAEPIETKIDNYNYRYRVNINT